MKNEKELKTTEKDSMKRIEEIIFDKSIDWNYIGKFVEILVNGVKEIDNPKRMRVEIRLEEEFGNDLSSEAIFEMVDKEFEKNKVSMDLDICRIWKLNEYVVIVGVKL